jgi:RNA polymerase sigma factor (sigma-70 family)
LHRSLNFLVDEYCESLKRTRQMKTKASKRGAEGKNDVSQLSSMENSLSWALEYMVTGYMPMGSEGPYKNCVPSDPQLVLSRYSNEVTRKLCNEQKIEAVLNIMDKLSEKERDAIMLVYGEKFSYREAGKIMGIPATTVWDNVQRARQKLESIKVEQYRVREVNDNGR